MENSRPAASGKALDVLRIHPSDNVCVATHSIEAGASLRCDAVSFVLTHPVRRGSKLALADLPAGTKIIKFGEPIGTLLNSVRLGEYIHTHNLDSDYLPAHARAGG